MIEGFERGLELQAMMKQLYKCVSSIETSPTGMLNETMQ